MGNLKIRKLAIIDGYDSGRNGNLLVAIVDKVMPTSIKTIDGTNKGVEVLICTATITNQKMIDKLEELVDKHTPCNRVIVISDKFLTLNKKHQLALLELESKKVEIECKRDINNNLSAVIQAEVWVMTKFGKFTEWYAVNKARRFRESSERSVATGLHQAYMTHQRTKQYAEYVDYSKMDFKEVHDEDIPQPQPVVQE